jgi:ArsR family transcriptional regulator
MLLLQGELCVCDLMVILGEPQSKISRHLAYLKHSGIVSSRRVGLWMHYSLKAPLEETFQVQLHLFKETFSSRPPFHSDIKKMSDLKAQGGCKAMIPLKSAVLPRSRFSGKRSPSFAEVK